ncbi:hypothetical protein AB6A40_008169 [Gnathostoma spinigerum]|uniref:rhomboid protease n=1 Tax=Gnathostoma spinigerum TaxID=75299 RepID=A0ABD6EPJ5_9BILA
MQSLGCESTNECYSWKRIFAAFDTDHDGYIPTNELTRTVRSAAASFGLTSSEADALIRNIDANRDHLVDFPEFCTLMTRAKKLRMRHVLFRAAQMVVPKSGRAKAFSYLEQYTCMPPPLFMITISIMEVAVYIYYVLESHQGIQMNKPVPTQSPLIFNPHKKTEIWRYFTYMLIHVGIFHIIFNVMTQVMLGIPLELVHKAWRIMLVYLSGVLAGSLVVSIFDPNVYLAGASGGVYALLAAHLAELIINWSEMEFAWVRAGVLTLLIGSDASLAIYQRYYVREKDQVSYVSHLAGFIAGILMGIIVLRNFSRKSWERFLWWISFAILIVLLCTAVVINIFPSII